MSPSKLQSDPIGGADRDRTDDLLNANQALFQLSYGPEVKWANRRLTNEVETKNKFFKNYFV